MEPKSSETIVVSVSTIHERDMLIKRTYQGLHKEPNTKFSIVQDQVNRIKVFLNCPDGMKVLIRTYIVLIIPIIVDLNPLHSLYGNIDFHLEKTISHLQSITRNLQSLQGRHIVKGSRNEQTFKQLARSLCEIHREHGASESSLIFGQDTQ